MSKDEAIKRALEALEKADSVIYSEYCGTDCDELQICEPAIKALEEALAKQEKLIPSNSTELKHDDPCPDCGKQLFVAPGGGVKCTCGYWFCF